MTFKQTLPTEEVLKSEIVKQWGDFDRDVKDAVGPLEAEYKEVRRRQKLGAICFATIAGFFIILEVFGDSDLALASLLGEVIGFILTILFFPFLIVLGIVGYRLMRDKNNVVARFNKGLNAVLFTKVLSVFGLTGAYITGTVLSDIKGKDLLKGRWGIFKGRYAHPASGIHTPEEQQVMDLLDHSELVTESRNTVLIDDMVAIDWQQGKLFLAELDLKHITGSGKNRKVKKIFSGYFVSLDLARPLSGKTFVSTEGDTKGFGHQSFWKNLTGGDISVTELEWNDFENLLHVATSNPTEARYILTTDFMADLYDWWQDKKRNIRISFIGSRMYLLFPSKKVRFKSTVPSLDTTHLQDYAMTIATPLMHVLHLAEEVKN